MTRDFSLVTNSCIVSNLLGCSAIIFLSDESTQLESSQISLVQVDLEQIKYKIKYTFLDQMEMPVNR